MPFDFGNLFVGRKLNISQNAQDVVTLYFWHADMCGCGHISMLLPSQGSTAADNPLREEYVSFWPTPSTSSKLDVLFSTICCNSYYKTFNGSCTSKLADDISKRHNRSANETISLYGLDIPKMKEAFRAFKDIDGTDGTDGNIKNHKWSLLGQCCTSCCDHEFTHSCSSLIYSLLKIGGIENFLPVNYCSMANTVIIFIFAEMITVVATLGIDYLRDKHIDYPLFDVIFPTALSLVIGISTRLFARTLEFCLPTCCNCYSSEKSDRKRIPFYYECSCSNHVISPEGIESIAKAAQRRQEHVINDYVKPSQQQQQLSEPTSPSNRGYQSIP